MTEAYVCKVTSVGQMTLPKEIREDLKISEGDYVILEKIGGTYFIRKYQAETHFLAKIREKVKKTGITRQRLQKIIEEESKTVWQKTSKSLP